jgi:hypothetical protein
MVNDLPKNKLFEKSEFDLWEKKFFIKLYLSFNKTAKYESLVLPKIGNLTHN